MTDIVERVRALLGDNNEEQDTIIDAADEIERLRNQLILVEAERDGLASVLEDVRADYLRERALVDGLTKAILDHIGASLEYNRD